MSSLTGNPTFDTFVDQHRWAVLTTLRASGAPVSSVVAYAIQDGELVISTPGHTFKRESLARDPRTNLCIISNAEPFNFVAIEGHARIESDDILDATRLVFRNIESTGYKEPENLEQWLIDQSRVILRITPDRVHGVIR